MLKAEPTDTGAVIRAINDLIKSEGLVTGDRLPSIRQLSATLGLGPNVVRDALLRAQTMGLVRIHPRSGAFVQSVDLSSLVSALDDTVETTLMQGDSSIVHLIEARHLIEVDLAGKAAARRRTEDMLPLRLALDAMDRNADDRPAFVESDESFHLGIAGIAGNPALTSVLRALLVLLRPHRMSLIPTAENMRRTERLHEEIYCSVRDGDADAARAAMSAHLTDDRQRVLAQIATVPSSLRGREGEI